MCLPCFVELLRWCCSRELAAVVEEAFRTQRSEFDAVQLSVWFRCRQVPRRGHRCISLRKQPTFYEVATSALAKRRLSNERRNSILMTRLKYQPMRSTTKIWVETRHQYGISALVAQTSFCQGSSGDLVKRRLFSQAIAAFTKLIC